MIYRKPEVIRSIDPISAIRQQITSKPNVQTTDLNSGYTAKTTVSAYEADE